MNGDVRALYERVRDAARQDPNLPETAIADAVIGTVDDEVRESVVIAAIEGWVWRVRREDQLAVERAAQRQERLAQQQHAAAQKAAARPPDQFQRLYDNPARMYDPESTERIYLTRRKDREAFRKWCGDRFPEWRQRASEVVDRTHGEDGRALFVGDWHPEGPSAAAHEAFVETVSELIDQHAQSIRLEFTAKLLASEFALGDGRRVTWAEASIGDHEQRIDLLTRNAAANAEAAARHRSAVDVLKLSGVDRLADVPALKG